MWEKICCINVCLHSSFCSIPSSLNHSHGHSGVRTIMATILKGHSKLKYSKLTLQSALRNEEFQRVQLMNTLLPWYFCAGLIVHCSKYNAVLTVVYAHSYSCQKYQWFWLFFGWHLLAYWSMFIKVQWSYLFSFQVYFSVCFSTTTTHMTHIMVITGFGDLC